MRYLLKNGHAILIDEIDLPLLKKYNWQVNNGYIFRSVQRNGVRKRFYLHREIMNAPVEMMVDHINGNPSDNRRRNLRICTHEENARNKRKPKNGLLSRYKGVTPRGDMFEASLKCDGVTYYIGTYSSESDAAIAYNLKAVEMFGEFAQLNDVPESCVIPVPVAAKQSSMYRGVMFHKRIGKWQASIQHNKKRIHIGYFESEEEAAIAYNEKAIQLMGENAKLNTIGERLLPLLSEKEAVAVADN